jgi:hypothetical protein
VGSTSQQPDGSFLTANQSPVFLRSEPGSLLFPAALGKTGKRSRRPLVRTDTADMLKRRLKQAGLPAHYSPHPFRATGITNFLENDGTLEAALQIAGHADSRTTNSTDTGRNFSSNAKVLNGAIQRYTESVSIGLPKSAVYDLSTVRQLALIPLIYLLAAALKAGPAVCGWRQCNSY